MYFNDIFKWYTDTTIFEWLLTSLYLVDMYSVSFVWDMKYFNVVRHCLLFHITLLFNNVLYSIPVYSTLQ